MGTLPCSGNGTPIVVETGQVVANVERQCAMLERARERSLNALTTRLDKNSQELYAVTCKDASLGRMSAPQVHIFSVNFTLFVASVLCYQVLSYSQCKSLCSNDADDIVISERFGVEQG